jgi:exodeoxyribonuclease VII large subunit
VLFDDPDVGRIGPADAAEPTWSVGELAQALGGLLQGAFPREIWVRGEIHDLSRPASGHVYFTLVEPGDGLDPGASLAVMLSSTRKGTVNGALKRAGGAVRMTNGTDVRVRGRLDWYAPRGQLQLRMTAIDPAYTLGQLEAARAALLVRLDEEGLLRANAGRPMPLVPLRVGLVTSAGSAAEADFVHELERSRFAFDLVRVDVRVQGLEAPLEIAAGVRDAAAAGVDVVALVRGGGAKTDLRAFDDERVARAIATCPVPVLTGIGHETDRAVADEVAHRSEKTPTACAQALIGIVALFAADLHERWVRIAACAARAVARHDGHVEGIAGRTGRAASAGLRAASDRLGGHQGRIELAARAHLRDAERRLAAQTERIELATRRHLRDADGRLAGQTGRIHLATRGHLRDAEARVGEHARHLRRRAPRAVADAERALAALDARVRGHDPARTLARGWSITRTADGRVVRSPGDAEEGDELRTLTAGGEVRSTVVGRSTVDPDG